MIVYRQVITILLACILFETHALSCESNSFTCLNNPRVYVVDGEIKNCPSSQVCNREKLNSCEACIDADELNQPTSRILGPNCNDGFGWSDPCRPADPGSGYYFKCIWIGPHRFTYVKKRCFWRCIDICIGNTAICQ